MKTSLLAADYSALGADLICVHLEATDVIEEIAARVHAASRKFAIALKPGTPADAIRPYLALCDMVLVMTASAPLCSPATPTC